MFESFSDVFMGFVSVVAVVFLASEITRYNKKMKDMIYILDSEDAKLTSELEELARVGLIGRYEGVPAA